MSDPSASRTRSVAPAPVWVFIDDWLVIDLGGVHGELEATVALDSLDWIIAGNTYQLSIFHAERFTSHSRFRVSTTIGCFLAP